MNLFTMDNWDEVAVDVGGHYRYEIQIVHTTVYYGEWYLLTRITLDSKSISVYVLDSLHMGVASAVEAMNRRILDDMEVFGYDDDDVEYYYF